MKLIQLTQGKFAKVDDTDFEWLNQWKWYAIKDKHTYYAYKPDGDKKILMHRLVLNISNPKITGDHIDCDGLNNQQYNLRVATRSQNNCNRLAGRSKGSSIFKGVCITKDKKKWQAHVQKDKKQIYLGCFETEIEAALAYNNAAKKLHGEFANLNLLSLPND